MEQICTDCGRWKKGVKSQSGFEPVFCECINPIVKVIEGIQDIETTHLYRKGIEIFGGAEKFRHYLTTFDIFLNCKPLELIKRGYGDTVIKHMITKKMEN